MSFSYLYVCKITALICQHKELYVFFIVYYGRKITLIDTYHSVAYILSALLYTCIRYLYPSGKIMGNKNIITIPMTSCKGKPTFT